MTRQSQRGSILIESLVILNISVLALIIHIELIRRIQCEVVLHHAAFLDAHSIALKRTDSKGKSFLKKALSYPARVRTERELSAAGGKVKRYFRYRTFLQFRHSLGLKHHMEVTTECQFPFS